MPSTAHDAWTTTRRGRLATLYTMSGPGAGTPDEVAQAERALVIALAAEFQGYCRDLHDLALDELMDKTATQTPRLEAVVRKALTNAALSAGNPKKKSIELDFARIGFGQIWTVARVEDVRSDDWTSSLGTLLQYRNAAAHGDYGKMGSMKPASQSIPTLCRGWQVDLDQLVGVMDKIVAVWLQGFLQLPRSW